MKEDQIKLGSKVRDKLTGIEGHATGRVEYLDNSPDVLVEYQNGDGERSSTWIDEPRLVVIQDFDGKENGK